jgi:pseudaminic acid synthase
MYKIASFEITDIPLIDYTAAKGKPMIISTGIADAGDIQLAVDACRRLANNDITLLQCTSSYPAPVELANLHMIPNLAETFGVKSGLSDHTPGSTVAVAGVALGATMVEKHFILDRNLGGPDASFSMEPHEFKQMVDEIRIVEKALGTVDYSLTEKKRTSRKLARSLFVVKDVPAGAELTEQNVRSIRPGDGMHPKHFSEVLGRRATRNLKRGEPLSWRMIRE